jgi:hypothetical protein
VCDRDWINEEGGQDEMRIVVGGKVNVNKEAINRQCRRSKPFSGEDKLFCSYSPPRLRTYGPPDSWTSE